VVSDSASALRSRYIMSVELLKMDEATSALDAMTQREMIDTLLALRTERTVMIIVHWASTVQSADHVVVPDSGQLMGAGSYQLAC
jgi:ABC-type bacteriocin/lantibiotic exporter with double-glycine peptidase domain